MHGTVSECTRTTYKPYPYNTNDGRDDPAESGKKVVRGGSWCDRPKRCRSAFRLSYPIWQRVHNVGFRVICQTNKPTKGYIVSAKDINLEETTTSNYEIVENSLIEVYKTDRTYLQSL